MAYDRLPDYQRRQARAGAKIALQKARMGKAGASNRQQVDEMQLMNEMRHNKVAVDLNRALFEYSEAGEKV